MIKYFELHRLIEQHKLNSIKVLISKALVDSNISHDEFVLINNALKEFYDMKKETKNYNNTVLNSIHVKQCYLIV